MFSSLRVPNYRLYFAGQAISLSGTWMQSVAQGWLVLDLTGSGTAIGLVLALQTLPVLLLGPLGGVLADRVDKRRLLLATQALAGVLAAALGLLVLFDVVRLWMVCVLAAGLGFVNLVDNPTRQAFVGEMVGSHDLTNAVGLNSVLVNLARSLGPAAAGLLIVTVGMAPCFLINAASFLASITALALMRTDQLRRSTPQPRRTGQLRAGFRYVRATPPILIPLLMMAVVGTLAYEFQVSLPLLARYTFGGDAGTYGTMTALMGAGAVVGGLLTAAAPCTAPKSSAMLARAVGDLRSQPGPGFGRHGAAGSLFDRLPRPGKRHPPALVRTRDARAGDGTVVRCLHGLHSPGRPLHRVDRRPQPSLGAGRRRPGHRARRARRLPAPGSCRPHRHPRRARRADLPRARHAGLNPGRTALLAGIQA
jgi:MFS family permease